jgi:hypothetical protein
MVIRRPKGNVYVYANRGWLRIRLTHQGKPYNFAVGLPDTATARHHAESICSQIERDISSGHFDKSLKCYKPERFQSPSLSVSKLFEALDTFAIAAVTCRRKSLAPSKSTPGWCESGSIQNATAA